jgi:hypothetical protein
MAREGLSFVRQEAEQHRPPKRMQVWQQSRMMTALLFLRCILPMTWRRKTAGR